MKSVNVRKSVKSIKPNRIIFNQLPIKSGIIELSIRYRTDNSDFLCYSLNTASVADVDRSYHHMNIIISCLHDSRDTEPKNADFDKTEESNVEWDDACGVQVDLVWPRPDPRP